MLKIEAVVKLKPEKIQASKGFEPMTSAIACAALYQLNCQASRELDT